MDVRVPSSPSTHLQLVVYEDHPGSDDMAVDTGPIQDASQQLENIDVVQQEQGRLAAEQAEQERLARVEQERQEQERQEQERLAQLELERIAQEQRERENQAKLEQKRQEQERLARIEQERREERQEQERQEQERQEQERLEQERLEQERARLEREKLEQERHQKEQEQKEREREEQQRAEQEDLLDEDLINQAERALKEGSVQAPAGEVSTSRAPKRGTQIDIEKAINDSKNCDDLHSTTNQRQETLQGQTQETAEHATSAPIPTPDQDPRETLIDSAASAARLSRLDTTKVHIKFKFLEEGI